MFGVEAINDAGSVLISNKHTHLVFSERGNITVTRSVVDQPAVGSVTFATPVTSLHPPKVFVRITSSRHSSMQIYSVLAGGPGSWTGITIYAAAQGGGVLPLYVLQFVACRDAYLPPTAGYGMAIYGEQGEVVFSHQDRLVKYSRFTKNWVISSSYNGVTFYTYSSGLSLASDDFVDITAINKGIIYQAAAYVMFTSMRIWRAGGPVLELVTQSSENMSFQPYRVSDLRFCMPICKFPDSVYFNRTP